MGSFGLIDIGIFEVGNRYTIPMVDRTILVKEILLEAI